jgi:SPP1 family predicted phage head-tail adaptor
MMIAPGRLKHRITIQQRTQAPGAFGQPANTWAALVPQMWAEVLPVSGRERLAAAAVQGSHTHTVAVRYQVALAVPAAVASRWRIVHGSVVYNVRSANVLGGGRQWIIFDVEEGGADGH